MLADNQLIHYVVLHYVYIGSIILFSWLFLALFHRLVLYPRFFSPLRVLPGPPLGSILIGQGKAIIKGEAGIPQREWVKQYGPVLRIVGPIGIERVIFIKPEALQQILASDWLDYPRPDFLRNVLGLTAGYGLLTVTGNEHRQMRKAMNPAFSIQNLMAQTEMYYEPIEGLIDILNNELNSEPNGKILHMNDWMSRVTLDIICETAFGYKPDSLHNPKNELADAYEQLISLQSGPNLALFIGIMSLPGTARFFSTEWAHTNAHLIGKIPGLATSEILLTSMRRIKAISRQILSEKMTEETAFSASDSHAKRDILSLLVRARLAEKDGEGFGISDKAMVDQVLTFLGAGHETTASGLSWTLWLLANNKAAQDRLRAEVAPLVADNPRLDYRSLKELQWLDCVVMESLRVMPPVPMTIRKAARDGYVDGTFIPKGTLFYIPIRVVNTYKEVWGEDAEEFIPERWLNLPKAYNPAFSLLSFIAGPHACIGKTMAIIEMKAVLASVIANFEFEPAYEGQVAQPTSAVTMKPKDNMPLRVKRVPLP